ncbi:histone deacetylase 6 isoform X2 [Lampris incognitus]|uniref:histone deacetylase 6 isoform X2 n=1 Tax=Lampris incognitus TaxID=2546036 RepID=UPI0024B5B50C|nr:histone deacetylase 6 isoform X2 [Lampris incognitus]
MDSERDATAPCPSNNTAQCHSGKDRKGGFSRMLVARRKATMEQKKRDEELTSQLQQMDLDSRAPANGSGLVYSEMFTHHRSLWEQSHPESPDRVTAIMAELERQGLLSRCITVEPRAATEEELLLVHMRKYVGLMRSTQTMTETELHTLSENYDSVYIHPESFQVALLAVGAVLQLVDKVMTSELRNGFAVARPPGHHAQCNQANGFCLFNNVAIATRYAQKHYRLHRVLIVDWDVHHGQGIQYIFQEDPSVLYFSVHRHEQGSFWPHLPESGSQAVGTGTGQGYNINLAWNKTGMKDADYIAAFQQLLLPVAYEFQPQLVLVAAGFDTLVGDPKGEMCTSPEVFSVLTHMLMGLAQGRLILALEGGYNLQSTAEGAAACVRSLLGEPCLPLQPPTSPSDSALSSISETVSALCPYWSCLQVLEGGPLADGEVIRETANQEKVAETHPAHSAAGMSTGLVYDQKMMDHLNMWDRHHPENPQRISRIFSKHEELRLVQRCLRIPARLATEEELAMCHGLEHIAQMKSTEVLKPRDLHRLGDEYNSIYLNNQSYHCALLAAGACFNTVHSILTGQVSNGVAIVRPPGHHAEKDLACGFCLFNTVALTACYAQSITHNPPLRVLILDWDVHHGNGTQHIFEEDDSVLYISLHRYENGTFFPSSEDADCDRVGVGRGVGFNVNIPWSGGRMGDSDYLAAFHHVVMPIAVEFNPGLVLISAGFDAARGDPLGGYHVTPEGYAHITHMLMSLAGGRVLVILEGGYNLTSISESMAMCTSMLLGDAPPSLATPLPPPHHNAVAAINKVIRCHAPYWRSLRIHIPESLRMCLPSPKHRGKRSSRGGGRKSNQPSPDKPPRPSTGMEGDNKGDSSLDQLAQGLASLDITQTTPAIPSPRNRSSVDEVKEERHGVTPEKGQSLASVPQAQAVAEGTSASIAGGDEGVAEAEGACGWSKPQAALELVCGGKELDGSTMYVVDPLSWCPHLDVVKPLPPAGIDIFLPCQDCGSEAENWTCLTCYQVFCGRYINEHMVTHGLVSEHPMVLSFSDLSVWCYCCEAYIHNKVLFEAKNAAHCAKFGEELPPWS